METEDERVVTLVIIVALYLVVGLLTAVMTWRDRIAGHHLGMAVLAIPTWFIALPIALSAKAFDAKVYGKVQW